MIDEIAQNYRLQIQHPYTYPSADRNPAAVYIASLAPRSQRVQILSLRTIVAVMTGTTVDDISYDDVLEFPFHQLRYQHTHAIRTNLAEIMRFSSANRCLAALRRVLKECWRLGYIDNETMARAVDLENIAGETVPKGRDVSAGEINALVDACYHDKNVIRGIRDMAILGLLYTTGMRRNEIVGLTLADYTPDENKLLIRHGKRNKERFVYVPDSVRSALDEWLTVRGIEPGALFLRVLKSGAIKRKADANGHLKPISAQAIYDMLANRALQANVAEFSPHDMRRTFVGDSLDAGIDIATVSGIAGHASIQTTARYDRRGERAKQDAVKKLHFPYKRRKKSAGGT